MRLGVEKQKEFKPLKLEVTIESREELAALWLIFNEPKRGLTKEYAEQESDWCGDNFDKEVLSEVDSDIWSLLDDIVEEVNSEE